MIKIIKLKNGERYRGEDCIKLEGGGEPSELAFFDCATQKQRYISLSEIETIENALKLIN